MRASRERVYHRSPSASVSRSVSFRRGSFNTPTASNSKPRETNNNYISNNNYVVNSTQLRYENENAAKSSSSSSSSTASSRVSYRSKNPSGEEFVQLTVFLPSEV